MCINFLFLAYKLFAQIDVVDAAVRVSPLLSFALTYSLSFCVVRDTSNTRGYLALWQSKLRYERIVAFERGIFVDQSWMDLVPRLFDNVRHPDASRLQRGLLEYG